MAYITRMAEREGYSAKQLQNPILPTLDLSRAPDLRYTTIYTDRYTEPRAFVAAFHRERKLFLQEGSLTG